MTVYGTKITSLRNGFIHAADGTGIAGVAECAMVSTIDTDRQWPHVYRISTNIIMSHPFTQNSKGKKGVRLTIEHDLLLK